MKLNLLQVARALDSPVETIERWIRQGRIPIQRNGTEYIFQAEALEKWAGQRKLPFTLPTECPRTPTSPNDESLLESMRIGKVFYLEGANNVQSALKLAVTYVPGLSTDDQPELYHHLMERESLASTGIGNGIAIPHPRTQLNRILEHSQITTCFLEHPINYNAIDDKPVFVLFILLSHSTKHHLKLISRLSFCLRNNEFVSFLRQKPLTEDIFQKIAAIESSLDKGN